MSVILRKPSVAVVTWGLLILGLFAWRGDLSLSSQEERRESEVAGLSDGPGELGAAEVGSREPGSGEVGIRESGSGRPDAKPSASAGSAQRPVVVRRRQSTKLPRKQRLGRVFDSMGFLLVGAEIVPADGPSQKTDGDGAFTVELLEHRVSDVLVRAVGRRHQWLRTSAVSPDPLVVVMVPGAPWDAAAKPPTPAPMLRGEGAVVGPADEPLAHAFVNVLGTDCWGQADETGRLELPLPATSVTLVLHQPGTDQNVGGIAAISQPFASARARGVVMLPRLVGERGGSIRGTVRDARGQGVAGLPVEVRGAGSRRRVQTGVGGVFVVSGLVPADYEVEPFAYRGAIGAAVSVRVDRAAVACDLHLQRIEDANVRVVHEDGAVAKGVWIATNLHGQRRGVDQSDEDGFVSLPVTAASEFEVRTSTGFASCVVREFDATAEPATLVISQP